MKTQSIALIFTAIVCMSAGCGEGGGSSNVSPSSDNAQTGKGGSTARFAIVNNTLYCVVPNQLQVYDISTPTSPAVRDPFDLPMGLETIFPYRNRLFIGANDGMYIFDNSFPSKPILLSRFSHVQSCDPVVVQGDYAYITLRGGSACRQFNGQSSLDVVDISNMTNPRLIDTQPISSPYGLGVDESQLFVCEGDNGLKIFDLTKPEKPVLKQTLTHVKSFDVIPFDKTLLVTGDGGLYQYDYSDTKKLELLSKIPIEN
jgi:hypothetical protein